jgi:hypothetical protein
MRADNCECGVAYTGKQIHIIMTILAKVRFDLDADDWHGHGSETLWASPLERTEWRTFRIENSPFFTQGISYQDIVSATLENHIILERLGMGWPT